MLPINDKTVYVFIFFFKFYTLVCFIATVQELKGKQKEKRMLGIVFYPQNSNKNKRVV